MRLLVEHGADPSVKSGIGSTALMLAAGAEVAHPTEDSGTFEDSLAAVKVALELGNDVNAVNDHGNTALHNAAFIGALNVIEFLVDNGATLDVKNQKDMTPLDRAHIDYHAGQISVILGYLGSSGKKIGQFGNMHGMACPSENELWVGEEMNWRVQKLILHPERSAAPSR